MGRPKGATLTIGDVIDASVAILAQGGVRALEMSAVSKRLSIRPPSLYHHVRSAEELKVLVTIAGMRSLLNRYQERAGGASSADAVLKQMAIVYRQFARENPGWYELMSRTVQGVAHAGISEVTAIASSPVIQAFSQIGLSQGDAVHAIRGLCAAVHGFILLELGGGLQLGQNADVSFARMVDSLIDAALDRVRSSRSPGRRRA